MFENILKFFKKFSKENNKDSKDTAKERLHLVLMQDRANVSADFLEMMKQEIIEVIKKYIDVDENSIDVKLTNKVNADGTTGAPALYANIPIVSLKDETKNINIDRKLEDNSNDENNNESDKKENEENKSDKIEENNKVNVEENDNNNEDTDKDEKEIDKEEQKTVEEVKEVIEEEKKEDNNQLEDGENKDKK